MSKTMDELADELDAVAGPTGWSYGAPHGVPMVTLWCLPLSPKFSGPTRREAMQRALSRLIDDPAEGARR